MVEFKPEQTPPSIISRARRFMNDGVFLSSDNQYKVLECISYVSVFVSLPLALYAIENRRLDLMVGAVGGAALAAATKIKASSRLRLLEASEELSEKGGEFKLTPGDMENLQQFLEEHKKVAEEFTE